MHNFKLRPSLTHKVYDSFSCNECINAFNNIMMELTILPLFHIMHTMICKVAYFLKFGQLCVCSISIFDVFLYYKMIKRCDLIYLVEYFRHIQINRLKNIFWFMCGYNVWWSKTNIFWFPSTPIHFRDIKLYQCQHRFSFWRKMVWC